MSILSKQTKLILTLVVSFSFVMLNGCIFQDEKQASAQNTTDDDDEISLDSTEAIYRQFFFCGTHNSYSGNLDDMNREGIETQLATGFRFFEFDLFSYSTEVIFQKSWSSTPDDFLVFDYADEPYLLTYSNTDGVVEIYDVASGPPQLVYENTLTSGERSFAILLFESTPYVFSYHISSGELSCYSFSGSTFSAVASEDIGAADGVLSAFVYDDTAYIGFHNTDAETFTIAPVSLSSANVIGTTLYTMSSVAATKDICPFVQNDVLYLFIHSSSSTTYFTVAPITTSGTTWATGTKVQSSSDLLDGTVEAVYATDGRFYVNSYATDGEVTGAQLVMDNDIPNMVSEYSNEDDMLTVATPYLYPAASGYYLLLEKSSTWQLSEITIGTLTLGHDAVGDEVDLDVDNPNSLYLEDWLEYINDWSDVNPYHEPLYIMTELKDYEQWCADAKWQNIIYLMQDIFGDKLRYHSSSGFWNDSAVDQDKIVDGETLYYMDEDGDIDGGLLGKVILYIQPNNKITKSAYTNDFQPFNTTDGVLQENFEQLALYRENNKFVSPDWRYPEDYDNDIGQYIDDNDNSYISRIFHMENSDGDGQYDNIKCTNVMFAISDRPYDNDNYADYVEQQEVKNELEKVSGCD